MLKNARLTCTDAHRTAYLPTTWRLCLAMLLSMALAACGGGGGGAAIGANGVSTGDNTNPQTAIAARIEIAPDTVLFTAPQQQKQLVARVYDAAGNSLTANVQWTSSRAEQVAVDGTGKLTATGSGGSAQIIARIGDLQSVPLLAVHTQVPAGAIMLTDANISGQPEETSPGALASFSNTYSARLVGIPAPKIGDLVINTEGKTVGGRVRAVTTVNGEHLVTLGLVSATEMFPKLDINEALDLNNAAIAIPDDLQRLYNVAREGNTFTFTPKPASITVSQGSPQPGAGTALGQNSTVSRVIAAAVGTSVPPPFKTCKKTLDGASGAGSLPITLSKVPLFSITLNNRLDVIYTPEQGLQRFVLHGEPSFTMEAGLKSLVAFEGKVGCEVDLLIIRIPVGGPLAFILGGLVPVGVGVELGGKVTLASLAMTVQASAKTTVDVGLACPTRTTCDLVKSFGTLTTVFTPTMDGPGLKDLRVDPTLAAYGYAKASIGNPFFSSLRFDALSVKVGAALKGSFAPRATQIADTTYKSDYKLVAELKAGADTEFKGLAALLGFNGIAENQLELSTDLATSPSGAVSADKASFTSGETVNFNVKMNPANASFLPGIGPYNIKRLILVRNTDALNPQTVATVSAVAGQTEFNISFVAPNSGRADEFSVFLITFFDLDVLELEVGQVASVSELCVPSAAQEYCYTMVELPEDIARGAPVGMTARNEVLYPRFPENAECSEYGPMATVSCATVWSASGVRALPVGFLPVGIADDGTVAGTQRTGTDRLTFLNHPAIAQPGNTQSLRLATSVPNTGNEPTGYYKQVVSISAAGRVTYKSGTNGYSYSGTNHGYCDARSLFCFRWAYFETTGPAWGPGLEIRRDELPASDISFYQTFDGDASGRVGFKTSATPNQSEASKDFVGGAIGRRNRSIDSIGTLLSYTDDRLSELSPPSALTPAGWQAYALGQEGHALVCTTGIGARPQARMVNLRTGQQGAVTDRTFSFQQGAQTITVDIACDLSTTGNWVNARGQLLAYARSSTNPQLANVILTPRGQPLR